MVSFETTASISLADWTQDAFSSHLGSTNLDFFMLIVDLVHEMELGLWKAVLCHLIWRIRIWSVHIFANMRVLQDEYTRTSEIYTEY